MLNTACLTIDLDTLRDNYRRARRQAGRAQVYAVVKSDAYGHGLRRVVQALPDAHGFALVLLDEARQLRDAGVTQPILLLEGVASPGELAEAARLRLTVVVRSDEQLAMLRGFPAGAVGVPLAVWLKVNTGMNRFGFRAERVLAVRDTLLANPAVRLQGLMTHFACADDLDVSLEPQWAVFQPLVAETGLPFSAANSAATLRDARTHGQVVRVGSLLYGNNPFDRVPPGGFAYTPVLRLEARLIGTSTLRAGEALGYGAGFVAERAMRVGIVGCGYGDGYPYAAPTGTPVLLRGRRTRTVGRVAMNVLAIDLEGFPEVQVGESVTLWGDPALPIGEVAQASGLIAEALQCGLTKRLPVHVIGDRSRVPLLT